MNKQAKIYVAGHRGLVGSSLVRQLKEQGYTNLILRTHAELDLTNQSAVEIFFAKQKPIGKNKLLIIYKPSLKAHIP